MSALADAGLWLSLLPAILLAAGAGWFGDSADAVRAGALVALPVAAGAALALGACWRRGIQAALAGLLAGVVIRLGGLVAGGLILVKALGHALVPSIASLGACVLLGLVAETAARCRSLPAAKEPARA